MNTIISALFCSICLLLNQAFAAETAAFFYGKHVPFLQLCSYDNIIVDPNSDFNPLESCSSQSQAFAYVSLGEVAKDATYANKINPEWIMGKNVAWNSNHVIDQTNKDWQQFFMDQIITPLWQKGYHGFFLDTLDSYILAVHDPALQQKQIAGMVSLIQQIKTRYPDAKIMLNRGFQLLPQVHSQVYAVVIESLYQAWNQQKQRYEETSPAEQKYLFTEIAKIRNMQLPIIVIDYLPVARKNEAQSLADKISKQGMIPFITDSSLQKIYLNNVTKFKRKILVMFNDENNYPTRFVPALRFVAPMLEYMGYVPDYFDLQQSRSYPKGNLSNEYAGIILWLDVADDKNVSLLQWAQRQITNGVYVVFINTFGVPIENKILSQFGLSISSVTVTNASLQASIKDSTVVGFEAEPPITPYDFYPLRAHSSKVLLQMKNEYQQTQDNVAITPWGGYALPESDVIEYLPNYHAFWIINPLEFFRRALRLQDFPMPDTTTENGRRLMTVHIDGDGFSYPAKWIGGSYAAVELRDKILKKYRIPTSVSVITGEIAPNGIHPDISPKLMDIARSIFELPWVESASHSFSHPFYWQASTNKNMNLFGEPFGIKIPNYKFNLATEITGSVDFINNNLVPANRKCKLFFWSGMGDPSVAGLKLTYDDNLLNINGVNDTYIDDDYPSLSGIRPKGIELDSYYQVFAPIDMDFYYMNSLLGPLYGYETVIQTLKLTDKPRRFKPLSLYYHFYSASYVASLEALNKVYAWALKQPIMNIYISDYIKKVIDFYETDIATNDDSSWLIQTKSEVRELRSPRRLGYPDLDKSKNVIGFKEINDDLYIHLGPADFSSLSYQKDKTTMPYLVEANARVTSYTRNKNQITIKFSGYMPLQFTLANVKQCKISSQSPMKMFDNQDTTLSYTSVKERDEIRIDC